MVKIRELPPEDEEPYEELRRPSRRPARKAEAEEPEEPAEPKPKKMGRPRKPDGELKYPRRERAPKPKKPTPRTEEEKPLPIEQPPPPPPPPQEPARREDDRALMHEFCTRFGSMQRRQETERRDRYRTLFRTHYS